jgi:hypothetical protein
MRVNLYAEVDPEIRISRDYQFAFVELALKHSQTFTQAVIAALREMHTVGAESGAYVKLLVAKRVPIPMVNTWAEDEAPTRRRS